VVVRCAADKLMLAVGLANQFGVAELADGLAAVALPDKVFQFPAPPRYATGEDLGFPSLKVLCRYFCIGKKAPK
jgi:hypothetical protein